MVTPTRRSEFRLLLFAHPSPIDYDVITLLILSLRDDGFIVAFFVSYRSLGEVAIMRLRDSSDSISSYAIDHGLVEPCRADLHEFHDKYEDDDASKGF